MLPHTDLMHGTVFEHATDPADVMDPGENRILAADRAGWTLLGYTREEPLSLHRLEFGGRIHILGLVQDRSEDQQAAPR